MSEILSRIQSPADLHPLSEAELHQLAQEMRDELMRVLSIRPAHFASNLGVVELCLALHLTFDFSKDRLIWDTGHQIYPHKLITGRFKDFHTIRTRGGLMGYPNPHESIYDLFMTGHAGCSLSCSLGLKVGDELLGRVDQRCVAVIGDGALPSGILFEEMGFRYIGPVDGHDLASLRGWLESLKDQKGPVLLHVLTEKGHGVQQASEDPVTFHTPPVFEKVGPERTILSLKRGGSKAFTDAASSAIYQVMKDDPQVAVITAAMCQGNKLEKVRTDLRLFPNFVVMAPGDELDVVPMLRFALSHSGPAAMRYPKANLEKVERGVAPMELGQAEIFEWGPDGALIAYGNLFANCVKAAELLRKEGLELAVINARFAKPLDKHTLLRAVEQLPLVVTVEEGTLEGGFGSAVLEAANSAGLDTRHIIRLGLPDRFIEHGERGELLPDLGLDPAGICNTVRRALSRATENGEHAPLRLAR